MSLIEHTGIFLGRYEIREVLIDECTRERYYVRKAPVRIPQSTVAS